MCGIVGYAGRKNVIKTFLENFGDDLPIEKMYEEKDNQLFYIIENQGIPLKEGVKELFSMLKEKNYKIENFSFDVIYTFGHTSDSVTYYFKEEKIMFTGDFIFKNSIGRTDLGGNSNDMKNSINKIKKYSDNIKIYPGHGDTTSLIDEKANNVYFNV